LVRVVGEEAEEEAAGREAAGVEVKDRAAAEAAATNPALVLAVTASARNAARRSRMLLVNAAQTRSAPIAASGWSESKKT